MSSSQKPCRHFVASSVKGGVVTAESPKSEKLAVGHVLKCVSRMTGEEVKIGMRVSRFAVEVSMQIPVFKRNVYV